MGNEPSLREIHPEPTVQLQPARFISDSEGKQLEARRNVHNLISPFQPKLLKLAQTLPEDPYKDVLAATKATYEKIKDDKILAETDPYVYLRKQASRKKNENGTAGGVGCYLHLPKTQKADESFVSAGMKHYLENPANDTSPKVYVPNALLVHTDIPKLVASTRTRPQSSPIQEVSLQTNYFGSTGVLYICPMLSSHSTTIQSINLARCCMTDEGFTALSAVLPDLVHLRFVDLSYNQKVHKEVTLTLIQCLFSCKNIQQLVLDNTNIDDISFTTLGLLTAYRTLFYLSVAGNYITQFGCAGFIKAATPNCRLQKFNIARNRIGQEGFGGLLKLFRQNRHLRSLNLSKNSIIAPWPSVVRFFGTNGSLGSLDLTQLGTVDSLSVVDRQLLEQNLRINCCLWQLTSSEQLHGLIPEMLAENWEAKSYFEESKYPFHLAFEVLCLFAGVPDVVRVMKFAFIGLFRRDLAQFFRKKHSRKP